MGKKGARTYGKQAAIFDNPKKEPRKTFVDEIPDPKSSKFYQDAVDEFHLSREKVWKKLITYVKFFGFEIG